MVLGGLTAPLVSWLKIPNEIDGTLDVDKIMELFNEEETEYLLAIDEGFAKWEAYLLIHGRDNAHNHSDATAQGRADKAWHLASMAKAAAIDARHRVAKAQVRCLPSSNPVHMESISCHGFVRSDLLLDLLHDCCRRIDWQKPKRCAVLCGVPI